MFKRCALIVSFVCCLCLAHFAQTVVTTPNVPASKLALNDFLDWEYVSQPQFSPDGKQIIYTRRWTDKINDRFESELWIMNADGSRNRFLTKGGSPVWSPDGTRLIYVAPGQPQGAQVFVRWMDTGDVTQLTRLDRAPSNLSWSPDGKYIAFNMLVAAKGNLQLKLPPRPDGAKWTDPPRVVERLNYRGDGTGYLPDGFQHIFIIAGDGSTPRQLTDGDYNHAAPQWMPDNKTLVFSAVRKPEAEYLRFGSEIYALDIPTKNIRQLTTREGTDNNPKVSPDGKLIAYTGSDANDDTYNVEQLYMMNADGTGSRSLTANLDRAPDSLEWTPDGKSVLFTCEDKGTNNVWSVGLGNNNASRQISSGNHQFTVSDISKDGRVVGTLSSYKEAGDVATLTLPTSSARETIAPRKLTNVNDDVLEGKRLGETEELWWDSVGGFKVQGWIVKPPDFNPAKKYPLMLYIHGGPHAMYGVGMNFEFQQHAAEDYVVLYTNPRGSTGYGKAFGNAINNNYPGEDYNDLMNGVDTVVKRGYIDERNLFVTGGSGGGVLTTWIVGHTNRFAAAVAMKPVINWYSFVGTTDGASWYYNFKKLPWEDPSEHLRRSPITYVGNVKTPTLLMTGELDLRTPISETEQFYRALKLRKIDTAMVRVNDEYHPFNAAPPALRHPSSRIYQISYLRGWFEKYRKQ